MPLVWSVRVRDRFDVGRGMWVGCGMNIGHGGVLGTSFEQLPRLCWRWP
jgi:hypothetical protein